MKNNDQLKTSGQLLGALNDDTILDQAQLILHTLADKSREAKADKDESSYLKIYFGLKEKFVGTTRDDLREAYAEAFVSSIEPMKCEDYPFEDHGTYLTDGFLALLEGAEKTNDPIHRDNIYHHMYGLCHTIRNDGNTSDSKMMQDQWKKVQLAMINSTHSENSGSQTDNLRIFTENLSWEPLASAYDPTDEVFNSAIRNKINEFQQKKFEMLSKDIDDKKLGNQRERAVILGCLYQFLPT